jgi:ketosteroid isomerase-like protein
MLDLYAEDAELDLSAVFTDMGVYRGRDSMRRQLDALWEAWEGVRMDPLAVFDVGGGRFVVDLRWWGRGKRSGVEVDQRAAFLYTFREADNKIVRGQLFPSLEAAMDFATRAEQVARTG